MVTSFHILKIKQMQNLNTLTKKDIVVIEINDYLAGKQTLKDTERNILKQKCELKYLIRGKARIKAFVTIEKRNETLTF